MSHVGLKKVDNAIPMPDLPNDVRCTIFMGSKMILHAISAIHSPTYYK